MRNVCGTVWSWMESRVRAKLFLFVPRNIYRLAEIYLKISL